MIVTAQSVSGLFIRSLKASEANMRNAVCFMLLLTLGAFCYAQYYWWPLTDPYDLTCNSTFGEYRRGTPTHFHEGIDIYPADNSNGVICTWGLYGSGYEVEEIRNLGGNYGYAVTVQHYNFTVDSTETTWVEQAHGSRYLHMDEYPTHLTVGNRYPDDVLIIENSSFYNDHLHFEIRNPDPIGDDYQNAVNPMFVDANLCPDDGNMPELLALYVDGSTDQSHYHQGDATIECWNFLDYDFSGYYNSTAAAPFVRLALPDESRDNDLDDPHFLLGGNCKARFVLKAKDVINVDGSTCAPYWISMYLDTALAPGDEEEPVTEGDAPFYEVKFEQLLESGDETHDEEDVYHVDEPLVSNHDPAQFYYRLYPYDRNGDGNLPSCIISGSWTVLETEDLEEGQHRIRVIAEDKDGHIKTADLHFYKRTDDWVDYCRGFSN